MSGNLSFKENYFDKKRNELILFIYKRNVSGLEKIYGQVREKIDRSVDFTEMDQKAINQIQLVVRRGFLKNNNARPDPIQLIYKSIRKRLTKIVRQQVRCPESIGYDAWKNRLGLSQRQFNIMLETITNFQITMGCSNFCRRCNEWALPGPRSHFTYEAVIKLTKEIFESGNQDFCHYSASDPLDWKDKDRSIVHIMDFMSGCGYVSGYGLLTKAPMGSEKIMERLLKSDTDMAVSITSGNRARIKNLERLVGKKFSVQHDVEELEIPAHLDEDFKSIKSSVTDNYGTEITPEAAFIIIPTFTSPLNPTGQCRIPVTPDTRFFLKKRMGRDALPVDYFKPLKAINLDGMEYTLEKLFDAQIENLLLDDGSDQTTPPGMMNLREYFKTFEPPAVKSREKVFPSVIKDLEKKILSPGKNRGSSRARQLALFREQVNIFRENCQMETVLEHKKNAFSFFLKSIAEYLRENRVKRELIDYLRKKERLCLIKKRADIFKENASVAVLLEEMKTETFDVFRCLTFKLLDHPDHSGIQQFIKEHPVQYDEKTGGFRSVT